MKILIIGDMHLRSKAPRSRTDKNFLKTCVGKFRECYRIFIDKGCRFAIQVGDFFDSPRPSGDLMIEVIKSLQLMRVPTDMHCIHGQHDMLYHTETWMSKSMLEILNTVNLLRSLKNEPAIMGEEQGKNMYAIGASFGQTPPPPKLPGKDYNILVAHAMVGDKPLWPGHELTGPEEYVKKHPGYDLYCLGDYHYPFSVKVGDAWVINPGCMLRLTSHERDRNHRPKVVVFDTEANEPENVFLTARPSNDVFLPVEEEKDDETRNYDVLVDKLRDTGNVGVNFTENLQRFLVQNNIEESVRKKAWDALKSV